MEDSKSAGEYTPAANNSTASQADSKTQAIAEYDGPTDDSRHPALDCFRSDTTTDRVGRYLLAEYTGDNYLKAAEIAADMDVSARQAGQALVGLADRAGPGLSVERWTGKRTPATWRVQVGEHELVTDGGHDVDPDAWYIVESEVPAVAGGPYANYDDAYQLWQATYDQQPQYDIVQGTRIRELDQGGATLVWETDDVTVVTDGGLREVSADYRWTCSDCDEFYFAASFTGQTAPDDADDIPGVSFEDCPACGGDVKGVATDGGLPPQYERPRRHQIDLPAPDAEQCLLLVIEAIRVLDDARAVAPADMADARDELKGIDSQLWNLIDELQRERYGGNGSENGGEE